MKGHYNDLARIGMYIKCVLANITKSINVFAVSRLLLLTAVIEQCLPMFSVIF
jgi:hypothetical protein